MSSSLATSGLILRVTIKTEKINVTRLIVRSSSVQMMLCEPYEKVREGTSTQEIVSTM